MENENNDLVLLRRGEAVITQDQILKFKEMINNLSNTNSTGDRLPLPKPPKPEIIYEYNGVIGIVIGITVFIIIAAMVLSKLL